jgi:hypothetical protein
MTVLSITCDNCGAKYKLPETFTGSQAKCQKCGSVIDVAKQRAAASTPPTAAKPAAAKPAAAARPAVDRSKSEPKPAVERPARPARAERSKEAAGGEAKAEDGKGRRGARGERGERPAKKSSAMPLLLGSVGLVAAVVVVVVMMMRGDDPKKDETAKADGAAMAAQKPADKPAENTAEKPAEKPAETPTEKPADAAGTAAPAAKPDAPAAEKPAAAPAATPEAGKPADASTPPAETPPADPSRPKQAYETIKGIASMADVTDPKTYPEVVWPASIDDTMKAQIRSLCDDVKNGGRPGIKAKPKLLELGHSALFGIVEALRTIDYKSESGNEHAFEFHKLLEEMTAGMGTGFAQVAVGEEIDPRKAEFNTRTVKAWRNMLDKFPDEESFKKEISAKKKKQAEADK